jgi:early secretory antigenic target protein ESAT-6
MTRYQVDTDAVQAATHTARHTIDRLHQDVATLTTTLHTLSGVWTGMAASAFTDVYQAWRTTHAHVEAQLAEITTALTQAGQHYQDMEVTNAALFRR